MKQIKKRRRCNECRLIARFPSLLSDSTLDDIMDHLYGAAYMLQERELQLVRGNGIPGPFQGALYLGQSQIQFPRGGWNFGERRYCNAVPPHPCSQVS